MGTSTGSFEPTSEDMYEVINSDFDRISRKYSGLFGVWRSISDDDRVRLRAFGGSLRSLLESDDVIREVIHSEDQNNQLYGRINVLRASILSFSLERDRPLTERLQFSRS